MVQTTNAYINIIEDRARKIHSLLRGSVEVLCNVEDILIVFDQVKTLKE
jgi:hypothetical protein